MIAAEPQPTRGSILTELKTARAALDRAILVLEHAGDQKLPGPMPTSLSVAYPWAWSWCPVDQIPVTASPDEEDGHARVQSHAAPNWTAVARAVTAAVDRAQCVLTPSLPRWATVQVPCDLDPASERVARAWLELREGVV